MPFHYILCCMSWVNSWRLLPGILHDQVIKTLVLFNGLRKKWQIEMFGSSCWLGLFLHLHSFLETITACFEKVFSNVFRHETDTKTSLMNSEEMENYIR